MRIVIEPIDNLNPKHGFSLMIDDENGCRIYDFNTSVYTYGSHIERLLGEIVHFLGKYRKHNEIP